MNWTWKRMHVLAATAVVDPGKRTTRAVADEARVSRQRTSIALKEMEHWGFVERTRLAHNKAEWRTTKTGFSVLAQELGNRARVPSKDLLYQNPLRVVRTARGIRGRLQRVGWRWWQVAWALKKRTVSFIRRILKFAKKAKSAGAYAWASLTRTKAQSYRARIKAFARSCGFQSEQAEDFTDLAMKGRDPMKTAQRAINAVIVSCRPSNDWSRRRMDEAFFQLARARAI